MAEILMQYGLFLAKAVTILAALALAVVLLMGFSRRERSAERLEVKHLNAKYESMDNCSSGKRCRRNSLSRRSKRKRPAGKLRRNSVKAEQGRSACLCSIFTVT